MKSERAIGPVGRIWKFLVEPRLIPGWILCLTLGICSAVAIYQGFETARKTRAQWASETRLRPESLEETRQSVTLFGRLSAEETVQKWQNRDEFFVDNIPANGPVHANALNRLGNLYAMQQKSDEAEQAYRQALETYEEYLGPEHDDVGIVRANLNALMTQPR